MQISKKVATVVAAGLITAGGLGAAATTPMAAFAADTTTSTTAAATQRTPAQWMTDALKGLVDKGTITQSQSDEVAKTLEAAKPEHGPGGRGHLFMGEEAATALGISTDELQTAIQANKSIATIAKEHNVDLKKVIDALVAAENTRIDREVTSGRITADQATTRKAGAVERVTAMVNGTPPAKGFGGRRFGRDMPDAPPALPDAPASAPSTTSAA